MGERFGNYELLEKIAVGGMAEIFLARSVHHQGIEKRMVIKRIHPTLANDKSFVAMFIDEARLGVTMVHGNIVPVFDFGYVDGYYFLAMEYVVGQNLAELHARAYLVDMRWPVALATYIAMEILEGLDYAHRKRDDQGRPLELVHRDVSPSNILISNDGQVKLLDFGIARSLAREYETRTGVIKGKPGYMSPEQAAGKSVDARADVWSSGSVLYELIQGHRLKEGRERGDDPILEEILDRSLSGNRDNRYRNAREFQSALADYLSARKERATSADLADFIRKVAAAETPGENWDLHSEAMEKHVAKALAAESAQLATKTSPQRKRHKTPRLLEVAPQTKRLSTQPPNPPKPKTRPIAPAVLGAVLLVLALALAVTLYSTRDISPKDNESSRPALNSVVKTRPPPTKPVSPKATSPAVKHAEPISATVPPKPAELTVRTNPPGAEILIDGLPRGKSPVRLRNLAPGPHRVVGRLPGRKETERTVDLQGEKSQNLRLTLPRKRNSRGKKNPKTGFLSVNSVPWTNVTLNGKTMGTTPIINRKIPAGKHVVLLTNPVRNLSKRVEIQVAPGEKIRIREILKAKSAER